MEYLIPNIGEVAAADQSVKHPHSPVNVPQDPAARGTGTKVKLSLQTRMVFFVVLLLSLLMLVTTYTGIQRESQGIMNQMQTDGIALAKSYALSAENALLLRRAGLGRVTGEASRTKGIKYLKIIDENLQIIGHTDVSRINTIDPDPLYRKALQTPITAVDQGRKPLTLISKDLSGENIFRVIIPLVTLDRVRGVLEIGLDMTEITAAMQRTNTQSLLIALAAFGCGGIFIWFFARSLMRPIRELVNAAERVAAGDLDYEIEVAGKDEIGHLALSFNYMTGRLREFTDNLIRINAELEADAALIEKLRIFNENILNSITPGVLTLDLDGYITTLNNAGLNILQLGKTGVIARRIAEVFDVGDPLREFLEGTLTSGMVCQEKELNISGNDARELWLSLKTAFLYDQYAQIVGYAVTFEDVTEVRQLQRRIHESEKMAAMGGLAAGIAHEVRNPLGAIKTSAQFLEDKFTPHDELRRFSQLIIREVERLDCLVERLLNFTRPGERDFQYEEINELIDNVVTLATLKVTNANLKIVKEFSPVLPRIFVDAKRLSQAFLNIILNAMDAMSGGGRLTIRTVSETENERLRIEFSDTGEGIPPEQINKIFDPFFTTRTKGTGLGLAIVQQIILEHNGTINVQSNPGEGTTISIILPFNPEHQMVENLTRFI